MCFLQTAKSSRPLLSGHLLSVLSPASVQGSGSQDITLATLWPVISALRAHLHQK